MLKKKVLIAGDTLSQITGLGKVAIRIAKGLYDTGNYEIIYSVITGVNSSVNDYIKYGESYKELFNSFKQIHNTQLQNQQTCFLFDQLIQTEKPEIVISILDPWNLDQIKWSAYRNSFFWVHYALFETPYYPEYLQAPSYIKNDSPRKSIKEILQNTDLCIPVTQMGAKILKNWNINYTDNVYLGIDYDKRITEKLTKSVVFKNAIKDDDFLFMIVGRNSERKKLDVTLEAFSRFLNEYANDKSKYKLYIHTDFNETIGGTDLISQIYYYELQHNIVSCDCFLKGQELDEMELYKRYSVCDCYISLPAGEGFGYGYLEALLHGKPIIYSNYGGHVEYCKEAKSLGVDIRAKYAARNVFMQWALADIKDASKKMKEITKLNKKEVYDHNVKFAEKFDWNKHIIPKFIKLIEDNYVKKVNNIFNFKRIV